MMRILCILACALGILSPTAAVSICKADLGLVVDTTESLGNETSIIPRLQKVLAKLVQKFDIAEDKTHVSLETFYKNAIIYNSFNDSRYWSVTDIIELIKLKITKLKRGTRLDRAVMEANRNMFIEANGDRSGERSALVVFTDGKSGPLTNESILESSIEDMKNKGVIVIAVKIGKANDSESQERLRQIGRENVIYLNDYKGCLDEAMDAVVNLVCIPVCKPNLGLVVDTTNSLGSENNVPSALRKALAHLVRRFLISEDKTHVSLETFHKKATVHNTFNDPKYWSVNEVIDLINDKITVLKSPTYLDNAMVEANETMFTAASGNRPGELNALVLLTDGRTEETTDFDKLEGSTEDLRKKDVLLIAVAIGPDRLKKGLQYRLKQIAGDNVFEVPDFVDNDEAMEDAMDDVFDLICGSSTIG